jgi:hypothetical protein
VSRIRETTAPGRFLVLQWVTSCGLSRDGTYHPGRSCSSPELPDDQVDDDHHVEYQTAHLQPGGVLEQLLGLRHEQQRCRHDGQVLAPPPATLAGDIFARENYGIALPTGSELRKKINETLLDITADGTYDELYSKYFGDSG